MSEKLKTVVVMGTIDLSGRAGEISSICALPRGETVEKIGRAAATYLHQMIESGEVHGVMGAAGCGPVEKEGP
jgi:DNA-binding transcriptional regulator LsrR (DeoR family)